MTKIKYIKVNNGVIAIDVTTHNEHGIYLHLAAIDNNGTIFWFEDDLEDCDKNQIIEYAKHVPGIYEEDARIKDMQKSFWDSNKIRK